MSISKKVSGLTKITKAEQLPSWFNLENYLPTQGFNLLDWYTNFIVRNRAYTRYFMSKSDTDRQELEKIWRNPICKPSDHELLPESAVTELNLSPLFHLSDSEFTERVKIIFQSQQNEIINLTINSSAPDEVIINELSQWLSLKRHSKKKPTSKSWRAFNETDMYKWKEYKVLAALDLVLYEMTEDIKITDSLLSHVLFFDDHQKNVESIRKTLRPMIKDILFRALIPLQAQIRSNLSIRNK